MWLWRLVAAFGAGAPGPTLLGTSSWSVASASSDTGSSFARAVDHDAARNGTTSHLRVLLDERREEWNEVPIGECECGWIEDTWDRGCGPDDDTPCWQECCSWKCSCEWAEVTCGMNDGTACWRHCCGGPECSCDWADEEGCGESDNSPCWHHCCDPWADDNEMDIPPPPLHGPPDLQSSPALLPTNDEDVGKGGEEECDCGCIHAGSSIAVPGCSGAASSVDCQMHCARASQVPGTAPPPSADGRGSWFQPWPEEEGIPMPPHFPGSFFNHTLWAGRARGEGPHGGGAGREGGAGGSQGDGAHTQPGLLVGGGSLLVGEDSHGGNLLLGDGSLGGSLLLGGGGELLVGGDSRGSGTLLVGDDSHGGGKPLAEGDPLGPAWVGSIVPLCFSPEVSPLAQQVVRAAAERFTAMIPCVVFREVSRLPQKPGELVRCSQAPAILITSNCTGRKECTCGPMEGEPMAESMRVLNLVDPDCLHRGLVIHELGHAIGTSRKRPDKPGDRFGVSLEAPSSVFLHKGAGILSGLSTLIWEWVWTPAALNSLDIEQLKQMYEMEEESSHPPLQGGPRCLDIPRDGVDICVQLSDENCAASEDVYSHCCVCGGGLKVQCPLGSAAGPFPGPELLADAGRSKLERQLELAQVPRAWRGRRATAGGRVLPLAAGCAAALLASLALAARHARRRTSRAVAPEAPDLCGGAGGVAGHLRYLVRWSAL